MTDNLLPPFITITTPMTGHDWAARQLEKENGGGSVGEPGWHLEAIPDEATGKKGWATLARHRRDEKLLGGIGEGL
jgi:hypothetical protein